MSFPLCRLLKGAKVNEFIQSSLFDACFLEPTHFRSCSFYLYIVSTFYHLGSVSLGIILIQTQTLLCKQHLHQDSSHLNPLDIMLPATLAKVSIV